MAYQPFFKRTATMLSNQSLWGYGVHTFLTSINMKLNLIVPLEFELANYNVIIPHISYSAIGISTRNFLCSFTKVPTEQFTCQTHNEVFQHFPTKKLPLMSHLTVQHLNAPKYCFCRFLMELKSQLSFFPSPHKIFRWTSWFDQPMNILLKMTWNDWTTITLIERLTINSQRCGVIIHLNI